ncbi:MAG: hypothetical protein CVU38_10825 [Chloroflexi bacterium HGW-Chloroflexi-1]|nr:MAG: hypothetical protein CVU38_10825 [Chloroflexi bacterium HGW-Chloroflexi-1]
MLDIKFMRENREQLLAAMVSLGAEDAPVALRAERRLEADRRVDAGRGARGGGGAQGAHDADRGADRRPG